MNIREEVLAKLASAKSETHHGLSAALVPLDLWLAIRTAFLTLAAKAGTDTAGLAEALAVPILPSQMVEGMVIKTMLQLDPTELAGAMARVKARRTATVESIRREAETLQPTHQKEL
jgi:hypothetical protein